MIFHKSIPLRKTFFFLSSLILLLTHINTSYSSINNTKSTAQSFSQGQIDQAVINQLKFIESGGTKPEGIVIETSKEAISTTPEEIVIKTSKEAISTTPEEIVIKTSKETISSTPEEVVIKTSKEAISTTPEEIVIKTTKEAISETPGEPTEQELTQGLVKTVEIENKIIKTVSGPKTEKLDVINKVIDEPPLIASISMIGITNILPKELEQAAIDIINTPEFTPKPTSNKHSSKNKKSTKRKIIAIDTDDKEIEKKEKNTTSKKKRRLVKVSSIIKAETPESPLIKVLKIENKDTETNRGRNQLTSPGWIYLGKFENNVWDASTLSIEGQLPEVGKQYLVKAASVNVRTSSNRKSKDNKIFHWLKKDAEVTILQLKRSGRSKHYWAEIMTPDSASK
ncbi:MAG TPA: hypothetical protein EYH35_03385 [Thiotrichaceae bacterium]|nr:hypothetical protein [Thiotrichaceae bacterium]